mgnify:CR=1 FL=1
MSEQENKQSNDGINDAIAATAIIAIIVITAAFWLSGLPS